MPELATGLTDILIVLSAVCCLISLPKSAEQRQWRLFFCLMALAAASGVLVHCLVLPPAWEQALWALFDLALGPELILLPLAAYRDIRGVPPAWLRRLGAILAAAASLTMIARLLTRSFSAQFPVAIAATALMVAAFLLLQLSRLKTSPRTAVPGLLGLLVMLLSGLVWQLGDFTLALGQWQIKPVVLLHFGMALALPLFRLSAGVRPDRAHL